jgi:hypothetical protein
MDALLSPLSWITSLQFTAWRCDLFSGGRTWSKLEDRRPLTVVGNMAVCFNVWHVLCMCCVLATYHTSMLCYAVCMAYCIAYNVIMTSCHYLREERKELPTRCMHVDLSGGCAIVLQAPVATIHLPSWQLAACYCRQLAMPMVWMVHCCVCTSHVCYYWFCGATAKASSTRWVHGLFCK